MENGRILLGAPWTVPQSAIADESARMRLLVDAVSQYAIFLLAPDGTVVTWNPGAERLKGYAGHEIVGRHFSVFYRPEDIAAGLPERQLAGAVRDGSFLDAGWRIRKDGSRFWAHVILTALFEGPTLRGFAKVTRDDTAARAAFERGRAMQEITRALLNRADTADVLAMVTRHARHLTGAARTWLATPHGTQFLVRAADGQVPGPQVGSVLPNDPVIANVMTAGQPVFVDDLTASYPRVPELQALGAGLLVPLGAGPDPTGVLVAASPSGASPFRTVDLELLEAFAIQAELVLSYDRAQQALRKQQVSDDRERIARDLHDHVIQQLFATGLALQGAALRSQDLTVRTRVEDAVDHLDDIIRQVRTTIFDLHERDPDAPESLRAQIITLVRDATRALTFQPALHLDGAIDSAIEPETRRHVLAALREMLSNVARHAAASAATVSVAVGDDVVLSVADNGNGPPNNVIGGNGLANLRARATTLGGTFTLQAANDHGTAATWAIPSSAPPPGPSRPRLLDAGTHSTADQARREQIPQP